MNHQCAEGRGGKYDVIRDYTITKVDKETKVILDVVYLGYTVLIYVPYLSKLDIV